ncbi:hypothetical protein J5N97_019315 [Dioscorea zingiberensis]|uniref:AAA-type ATPase N-terminal domain-containing protein n=1 Tax=Dioscorea zingiberensis TaxID=325984 RepID=A0A9D5HC69_9LILI|nr:hypothetical protein J5N97_019315 [Dioscorea zingiberensis]
MLAFVRSSDAACSRDQSLQCYLSDSLSAILTRFSSQITIAINEFENRNPNQLFKAAETYLGTKASSSPRKLRSSKQDNENAIEVSIDRREEVIDVFLGFEFRSPTTAATTTRK